MESFDESFQGYRTYDNGGAVDKEIIRDAKQIYASFRTSENIKVLHSDFKKQLESSPENIDEKAALKFLSICCASGDADYVSKYRKMYPQASKVSNAKSTLEKIKESILAPANKGKP